MIDFIYLKIISYKCWLVLEMDYSFYEDVCAEMEYFFLSSFIRYFLHSPNVELATFLGLITQMPVGQMLVGATDYEQEHWRRTQGRASLNLWSAKCQIHRQR